MAHYLIQAAYTSDAWAAMVKDPQDRIEAIRPVVESLGGRVVAGYLAFGEYDTIGILELPDNEAAATFAMAVAAGGALKALKTTPLLTTQEGLGAAPASILSARCAPLARIQIRDRPGQWHNQRAIIGSPTGGVMRCAAFGV